jgi:hypothetical protein
MPATRVMTSAERMCLHSAARDLHEQFRGVFGEETIESLLLSSYDQLAATATSPGGWSSGPSGSPASGCWPSPAPKAEPAERCPPCCSCACTTPGAPRWH